MNFAQRLWKEECDIFFEKKKEILDKVYDR